MSHELGPSMFYSSLQSLLDSLASHHGTPSPSAPQATPASLVSERQLKKAQMAHIHVDRKWAKLRRLNYEYQALDANYQVLRAECQLLHLQMITQNRWNEMNLEYKQQYSEMEAAEGRLKTLKKEMNNIIKKAEPQTSGRHQRKKNFREATQQRKNEDKETDTAIGRLTATFTKTVAGVFGWDQERGGKV